MRCAASGTGLGATGTCGRPRGAACGGTDPRASRGPRRHPSQCLIGRAQAPHLSEMDNPFPAKEQPALARFRLTPAAGKDESQLSGGAVGWPLLLRRAEPEQVASALALEQGHQRRLSGNAPPLGWRAVVAGSRGNQSRASGAANSPFRHGRDTGLASAREVTIRGWPRSGVPRAMRDFADYCASAQLLARAADVPDYTWFWWKLPIHFAPLGTLAVSYRRRRGERSAESQAPWKRGPSPSGACEARLRRWRSCPTQPMLGGRKWIASWWKMRPHPRLGTVEVRALDAQASLEDTAGLVALTHCLARHAAETGPEPDPRAEVLDEGVFRAARFGVSARLPDAQGRLRPVDELLREALALARRYAHDLRCTDQLDALPALLERGGGAGRQRAAYQIAGMDALLRDPTELTRGQTAQCPAR